MPLTLRKITIAFGIQPVLEDATLVVDKGDRACIVGRNGAGKSTLLKIASGITAPDRGEVGIPPGWRVEYLPQEIPDHPGLSAAEVVAAALAPDHLPEWEAQRKVERQLSDMALDGAMPYQALSAGTKRRILLARALVREPDALLLDEPTNHLDIDAIAWLEKRLLAYTGALLFVTHDRAFLQNVSTSILDLDRARITRWDCDYATYLQRKEEWLQAEEHNRATFDKKLAQEEAWIRQGVKARRTRNEGRVRALEKMREEHRRRRERTGSVNLRADEAARSGAKVITADAVTYCWEGRPLVSSFSDVVERGDRIGIVGPNGSGKTTLVRLLLGHLKPDSGSVEQGTGLQIAYYDQTREPLNPTDTVQDAIASGQQTVEIGGVRKHVISYLQDFLFPPERARSTVSMLSGGERNRLMLARLFAKPFNVLVMDEPTNDLDLETLELLEELLCGFSGTLLLVSHDRAFLDNVVTDLYVLDGSGRIESFVGGYRDYLASRAAPRKAESQPAPALTTGKTPKARKFLNRERWELEAIPGKIDAIDKETARIGETLADPRTYQTPDCDAAALQKRLKELEAELEALFARWEELEALRKELEA
jgi:ATP-binding cassette subfamily F protein uup